MARYRATPTGLIPFTQEEEEIWNNREIEYQANIITNKMKDVRAERNALLVESDWTQVLDAPVDQAAWATYRQALRDITAQEGFPHNINWPQKP
jgi:hypothetical protein